MIMRSILREPLVIRNAKSLEDLVRCCHALVVAPASKPQNPYILRRIQSSRRDESGKRMVVKRKRANCIVGGTKLIKGQREPHVLLDNLCRSLSYEVPVDEHSPRSPPASVAS